MSGPLTRAAAEALKAQVAGLTEPPSLADLEMILRFLAKWRSQVLSQTLIARQGTTVQGGLFAGMDYSAEAAEGSLSARLLGVYEAGLQPHIRRIVEAGIDCVIDLGCAEGYYAVGLARAFPHLTVYAHDISETARSYCAALAEKNGVADRVVVGSEFVAADFEGFAGRRALVIVDVEGAEVDILRPDLSPTLARMHVVVETHDVWRPGSLETIRARFQDTHQITTVEQSHELPHPPEWLMRLSELDQLLATWEWRHRLTPWLVMEPKS